MKTRTEGELRKLEQALTEAYRLRTDERTGEVDVSRRVMQTIRQSRVVPDQWATSTMLDEVVWRTATVAAAVVLVVTMLMVGVLHRSPLEQAGLLTEEFDSAPLFAE